MLIEYDLTELNQPNPDDVTTFDVKEYYGGAIFNETKSGSFSPKTEGIQKTVWAGTLIAAPEHETGYLPIEKAKIGLFSSPAAAFGTKDITTDKITCFDKDGRVTKIIESPGINIVDNTEVGSYELDLTDGTVSIEAEMTVNIKTVGTNSSATVRISPSKIYVDDDKMPAFILAPFAIRKNARISYPNHYMNICFKESVYSYESIIYSIPKGFYIEAQEGNEIEFSLSTYLSPFPLNMTLEVYDAEDNLLSTKTTHIASSSDKPSFIYKEGLNYIKALVDASECEPKSSQEVSFTYDSSSPLYYVYSSNSNGTCTMFRNSAEYSTPEEKIKMCLLGAGRVSTTVSTSKPASELYGYHIRERVKENPQSSSMDYVGVSKYTMFKLGDIVPIRCGYEYEIMVEKLDDTGNGGSTSTGTVKDIYFLAQEHNNNDNGTTPVEMTIDVSRNTAVNNDLLADSKRVITQEDATVSETNREVVYGDDIQADIKRYSTKPANILSDTDRTVEKVNRIRVKADTQRNKRKRIEVRCDLSRKLLGYKDDVYISSSLIPLKKATSKKIYS